VQDCPRIEPELLLREARSLANRDQTERAITKLEKLLQVDPHHAIANNDLGFLHYQRGEKEKARLSYEKAVAADGTNVTALKNLADFYFQESGETERSLQLYTMVLQMQPRDLEALKVIGLICLKLERFQDATEIFQKVQAIDPNDTETPQVIESLGRFLASQPASSPTIPYPIISGQSLQSSTAENLNSLDMKLN
jgi:Flp pilus assembly protein TadD